MAASDENFSSVQSGTHLFGDEHINLLRYVRVDKHVSRVQNEFGDVVRNVV